jgi:hypothetical protein
MGIHGRYYGAAAWNPEQDSKPKAEPETGGDFYLRAMNADASNALRNKWLREGEK